MGSRCLLIFVVLLARERGKGGCQAAARRHSSFLQFLQLLAAPGGSLAPLVFFKNTLFLMPHGAAISYFALFFEIQVFKTIGFSCLKVPPYRILRHSKKYSDRSANHSSKNQHFEGERGLEVDTISARLASTGSKIPPKVKNVSRISPQKKVHIPVVF